MTTTVETAGEVIPQDGSLVESAGQPGATAPGSHRDRREPPRRQSRRRAVADCASTAAGIRGRTGVSVAGSHMGAVIQSAPRRQVTVATSDPGDMRLVAGDKNITVAAI